MTEIAYRRLRFLLSLPERSLRALAALATGTTMLLTETLLPESVRGTRTYKVTFGMMQAYIVERIAQIDRGVESPDEGIAEDFAQRKMVGTALEAAGLFLVGASPLWIFAILADVSGGGKLFLDRLTAQLKAQGVIEAETDFTRLEEVLDAVQQASSKTATVIDTPPLSGPALRKMMAEIQSHYRDTFRSTAGLIPTLESLWTKMEGLSKGDRTLFNRLAGMMTVDALEFGKRGGKTAASVGTAGLQLFDERILRSYRRTLSSVSDEGVMIYLRSHYAPYFTAARRHFDAGLGSWTERTLGGSDTEGPAAL